jgi:hypothetical protein
MTLACTDVREHYRGFLRDHAVSYQPISPSFLLRLPHLPNRRDHLAKKTPGPQTCMRPTGTSRPSEWPRCARLKFCNRTTGAKRVARWRASYSVAINCFTIIHSPSPYLSIRAFTSRTPCETPYLSASNTDAAVAPPRSNVSQPVSNVSSLSCQTHLRPVNYSKPTPSRQDTLRARLFFCKEEERPPSRSRTCVMSFCRAAE